LYSPDYLDVLPLFFTLWRVNVHPDLILAIVLSAHLLRPVRLLIDACSWVKYPVLRVVHVDEPFPATILCQVNLGYPEPVLASVSGALIERCKRIARKWNYNYDASAILIIPVDFAFSIFLRASKS
jgi:hypothetical protein